MKNAILDGMKSLKFSCTVKQLISIQVLCNWYVINEDNMMITNSKCQLQTLKRPKSDDLIDYSNEFDGI